MLCHGKPSSLRSYSSQDGSGSQNGLGADKEGREAARRFIEVTTKFEKVDRPVPIDEAYRIAGMRPAEYEEMKEIVSTMFDAMAKEVEPRGLIHMDGKMEFASGS
jgi:phosphoribosylaminoimidazole-succinocarboxamide synthase